MKGDEYLAQHADELKPASQFIIFRESITNTDTVNVHYSDKHGVRSVSDYQNVKRKGHHFNGQNLLYLGSISATSRISPKVKKLPHSFLHR